LLVAEKKQVPSLGYKTTISSIRFLGAKNICYRYRMTGQGFHDLPHKVERLSALRQPEKF